MNEPRQRSSRSAALDAQGGTICQGLAAILIALALGACATRQPSPSDGADIQAAFPEVRSLSFHGNETFHAYFLRRVMATKARSLLTPWRPGDPYNPETLDADMLRIRKYYFDRGFLSTQAEVSGVERSSDGDSVRIDISIDEGPVTLVESVKIAGDQHFAPTERKALHKDLVLRAGDRLNREEFDASIAALLETLRNLGYARAEVSPETVIDQGSQGAQIVFTIVSGDKTTFGRIAIEGESHVPDHVIRRQLSFKEGDTYKVQELQDSQRRIFDLGMFNSVSTRELNLEQAGSPVDVQFDLRERKPRTIELGVGASSVDNVRYRVEWTNRNLFREADSLNLLARITGISQSAEVELRDPYFFDRETSAAYTLFVVNQKTINTDPFGIVSSIFTIEDPFPAYDFLSTGFEWRVEKKLTERLSGIAGLEYTYTNYYDIDPTADEETLAGTEDTSLFLQFVEFEWNNRDSEENPRSGELLRGKIDHANELLLSDASFIKIEMDGRYYLPVLEEAAVALRLKLGGIEPYGDTDTIPANERLYAGGPGSVRGYVINRLGPLDSSGNPIGGNSLIEGSVELRFPIAGPVGGTAFVDFGNVFEPSFTYPLNELKYSVGAGLFYKTPIGPLRFEVAYAIDPDSSDIRSPIMIGIGQAF